ncbi:hypothetical protein QR680_016693 [Steinernema hermaphroditum]|uniref:Uncharacterized protein n=1 Tax=Steinernema hermaphroditum TaxID=289476 RepID=A0AA39HEG4_9BILA|nr:hypothetical protein QR680_016693 [Steinernema hermaphroditum]
MQNNPYADEEDLRNMTYIVEIANSQFADFVQRFAPDFHFLEANKWTTPPRFERKSSASYGRTPPHPRPIGKLVDTPRTHVKLAERGPVPPSPNQASQEASDMNGRDRKPRKKKKKRKDGAPVNLSQTSAITITENATKRNEKNHLIEMAGYPLLKSLPLKSGSPANDRTDEERAKMVHQKRARNMLSIVNPDTPVLPANNATKPGRFASFKTAASAYPLVPDTGRSPLPFKECRPHFSASPVNAQEHRRRRGAPLIIQKPTGTPLTKENVLNTPRKPDPPVPYSCCIGTSNARSTTHSSYHSPVGCSQDAALY